MRSGRTDSDFQDRTRHKTDPQPAHCLPEVAVSTGQRVTDLTNGSTSLHARVSKQAPNNSLVHESCRRLFYLLLGLKLARLKPGPRRSEQTQPSTGTQVSRIAPKMTSAVLHLSSELAGSDVAR